MAARPPTVAQTEQLRTILRALERWQDSVAGRSYSRHDTNKAKRLLQDVVDRIEDEREEAC